MNKIDLKTYLAEELVNNEKSVNEGLIRNIISSSMLNNMDQEYLTTGILSMYDHIVEGENIKKFLLDYPLKERFFWKTLIKLYVSNIFGVFDIDTNSPEFEELSNLSGSRSSLVDVTPDVRRKLKKIINNSRSPQGSDSHRVVQNIKNKKVEKKFSDGLKDAKGSFDKLKNKYQKFVDGERDAFFKESRNTEDGEIEILNKNKFSFSDPLYLITVIDPLDEERGYVLTINKQISTLKQKISNLNAKSFLERLFNKIALNSAF